MIELKVLEYFTTKMVLSMKVSGEMERQTARASYIMLTATFMKVIGWTIKLMETELIHMLTELSMLASGEMTNSMGKDSKLGQTEQFMRVNISKARKMEMEG